ncbi:hypothetical protein DRP05_05200 [Archaeoglobales archaeon]|nr:MAG: hypothetical protein DRP05_05200 [Archaeoglobales archaeon]
MSGTVKYDELEVILINSTTGDVVDTATYSSSDGELKGTIIYASIDDMDGFFSTGDFLRFKETVPPGPAGSVVYPGIYEVLLVAKDYVVFDGFVKN